MCECACVFVYDTCARNGAVLIGQCEIHHLQHNNKYPIFIGDFFDGQATGHAQHIKVTILKTVCSVVVNCHTMLVHPMHNTIRTICQYINRIFCSLYTFTHI